MRQPFSSGLLRSLATAWMSGTTREGKMLAVGMAAMGSIASGSLDIPVFHLFCALSALVVVSYAVALYFRPRVELRGELPGKAVAGEPLTAAFTLVNTGHRPAYDLAAEPLHVPMGIEPPEQCPLVPAVEPGDSVTVSTTLRPLRRGLYAIPQIRPHSTFPLNLFRTNAPRDPARSGSSPLLVYPHFHALAEIDVPVNARYQPGGIALSSHVGESPEYIGNRPYRPGDAPRHLDFRAWARLAEPVMREYQEEYYCRIALVLDTHVPGRKPPGPEGFPNLEAAVSLAAAVADAMARGEYIIDIFAAGPTLHVFRAGRHTAHFDNVLEILACVEACRSNPFDIVTPALADELASISTVVCVLLDWDASREALVRAAVDCGCSVKVVVLRDGDTSAQFAHLAGELDISAYSPGDVTAGRVEAL